MSVFRSPYRPRIGRKGRGHYKKKVARFSGPCVTIYQRPGSTLEPRRNADQRAELERFAKQMRANPTVGESAFSRILEQHRLASAFQSQVIIGPFIVDFYHVKAHLAVEIDGTGHQLRADRDKRRDREIARHGVFVLRFTNREVFGFPQEVIARLLATIDRCMVNSEPAASDRRHVTASASVLKSHESPDTRHDDSHG